MIEQSKSKVMNHFAIHTCTCGYSTWSAKWMEKHMKYVHDENGVFSFEEGLITD